MLMINKNNNQKKKKRKWPQEIISYILCIMNCAKLTSLKTEMPYLSTEQIQPGKRQCNVPMCLNPDLEGQPLRMRGESSHRLSGGKKPKETVPVNHQVTQQVPKSLLRSHARRESGHARRLLSDRDQQKVLSRRDFLTLGATQGKSSLSHIVF